VATFIVDTQWERQDGALETKKFMFRYVDAGHHDEQTPWTDGWVPAKVIVRAVTTCKVESTYADDCEAYVQTGTPSNPAASEVPIALRFAK
jgi:hypothetical protein